MALRGWFKFKKIRLLLAWGSIPILLLCSNMNDHTFRWGIVLIIIGELIRFWALGFVEKKGQKLAMSGPYAFVRNPLYVGNFFLGLGVAVIVWNWIILVIFLVGFLGIYTGTIRGEEKHLKEMFGKPYEDYCRNVPSCFPRLTPYAAPEKESFLWSRIIKHHEYITVAGIFLMLMLIHLYDELFLAKEPLSQEIPLIGLTGVVVLALVLERVFVSRLHITFFERLREKHAPKKNP
ncbi:MAG: isoprenylcysteine carboxylmethyltransferase family protein [Candidatus Omnitrophota bacterium]